MSGLFRTGGRPRNGKPDNTPPTLPTPRADKDRDGPTYAELAVTTNFSFLRGASHPGDFVNRALEMGHTGIGIADRNSVAGVVRAHSAFEEAEEAFKDAYGPQARLPFQLVVGARLAFADETPDILAYPENREGWGRLCRLLTIGKRRAVKGECLLYEDDLFAHLHDLLFIIMPVQDGEKCAAEGLSPFLRRFGAQASGAVWLAGSMTYRGDDRRRLAALKTQADKAGVPLLAINDVLYHSPNSALCRMCSPASAKGLYAG
jgi:error-prone DNA polymerase